MKKLFLLSVLMLSLTSCRDEVKKEDVLLNSKTSLISSSEEFGRMITEEKISVWQGKLNQVLENDMSQEQAGLIISIRDALPSVKDNDYDDLVQYSLQLAEITSSEDFEGIFYTLDEYSKSFDTNASSSQEIMDDLVSFQEGLGDTVAAEELPNCLYRWLPYDTPAQPCQETDYGCGWFFLQPCTH